MARRPALALILLATLVAGCGSSPSPSASTSASTSRPVAAAHAVVRQAKRDRGAVPVRTTPSRAAVPILMYHVIDTPLPGVALRGLWVEPAAFRAQVAALAGAGFRAVTLRTVLDAWRGRARLPPRPIVLSFDDGYLGQGKIAGPILKARGWPGVLFLVLKNLGIEGGISATRIRTMIADGWEVGAHTLTHRDLTTLGAADLRHEVAGSRAAIARRFGVTVEDFCYPAGRYDARVEAVVRAAGFRSAVTEVPGAARPGDDRAALPRIRVDGGESAGAVLAAVRAAVGSAR